MNTTKNMLGLYVVLYSNKTIIFAYKNKTILGARAKFPGTWTSRWFSMAWSNCILQLNVNGLPASEVIHGFTETGNNIYQQNVLWTVTDWHIDTSV